VIVLATLILALAAVVYHDVVWVPPAPTCQAGFWERVCRGHEECAIVDPWRP
jgi:hypothetical protein